MSTQRDKMQHITRPQMKEQNCISSSAFDMPFSNSITNETKSDKVDRKFKKRLPSDKMVSIKESSVKPRWTKYTKRTGTNVNEEN